MSEPTSIKTLDDQLGERFAGMALDLLRQTYGDDMAVWPKDAINEYEALRLQVAGSAAGSSPSQGKVQG